MKRLIVIAVLSASGSVSVGTFEEGAGFYWMPTTGAIVIGGATGGDVSLNGRTIVGSAPDSRGLRQAAIWMRVGTFRWEESTAMVDPGSSAAGRASLATSVSADGRVAVGYQDRADGFRQGARWVDGRQEPFQVAAGGVVRF